MTGHSKLLIQCHVYITDVNTFIKTFGILIIVCHFTITVVRLDISTKELKCSHFKIIMQTWQPSPVNFPSRVLLPPTGGSEEKTLPPVKKSGENSVNMLN